MRKRKKTHRQWQRGKGKTGLEEVARGRNETRSSSGEVVPTKQKTRTRRARADADVDGDVNVDGAEGCFTTSRSWHAEKLFRGKMEGRGVTLCDPERIPACSEETVSGRCTRATNSPSRVRPASFRRLV